MGKSQRQQLYNIDRFREYYKELFLQSGLGQIANFTQHGTTSRLLHSVAVAYYSYRLALFTRLQFHLDDLVRGALLHDYFLYDAEDGDPAHKGHWTRHPSIAADNAGSEVQLTKIEEDIIRKHMFPLTLQPPRYREGVVVSMIDKACSLYEFFKRREPYGQIRREILREDLEGSLKALYLKLPAGES